MADSDHALSLARHKKCLMLFKQLGLSREERLEFVSTLLWRDVETMAGMDDADIRRVLDALEGYAMLHHLLSTSLRQP